MAEKVKKDAVKNKLFCRKNKPEMYLSGVLL